MKAPQSLLIPPQGPTANIQELTDVIAALRGPNGCPWDKKQTHKSLQKYVIEEAYEVVDAISDGDPKPLCEELGDLLLQVMLHSQIAHETQQFSLQDVIDSIKAKMIRRHPHVFSDTKISDADGAAEAWEALKLAEGKSPRPKIPRHLPSLERAVKVGAEAASLGFDWSQASQVLDKIEEEVSELREAMASQKKEHIQDELGDLLFATTNLARKLKLSPEIALRGAVDKFSRRFAFVQAQLHASNQPIEETSEKDLETLWNKAKQTEQEHTPHASKNGKDQEMTSKDQSNSPENPNPSSPTPSTELLILEELKALRAEVRTLRTGQQRLLRTIAQQEHSISHRLSCTRDVLDALLKASHTELLERMISFEDSTQSHKKRIYQIEREMENLFDLSED